MDISVAPSCCIGVFVDDGAVCLQETISTNTITMATTNKNLFLIIVLPG
jgi:hypothetical protein